MDQVKALVLTLILSPWGSLVAQNIEPVSDKWTVFNREADFSNNQIYLNANENDGILWLNNANFENGLIELDIKGKDAQGQSFVGIVFHGKDNSTFDGIYFRPFNFKSPQRKTHSIQYIAMPDNDWSVLREDFPDKYENTVNPVPEPNDWFHAKVVVDFPNVKVYVNGSDESSLEITQISDRRQGKLGLWVGNGSEGYFKNVTISSK